MTKPRPEGPFSTVSSPFCCSRRAALGALLVLTCGCPSDPLQAARQHERAGDLDLAGEAYLQAAKADPALLAGWDGAVRIFCRQQSDVGRCLAVLDFELELLGRVERHADALAEALEQRARARLETGLVDAARSDLLRAEKVAPTRSTVHTALARVALASGQPVQARQRLERARELEPSLAELEELWDLTRTSTPSASAPPAPDPSAPDLPAFGR